MNSYFQLLCFDVFGQKTGGGERGETAAVYIVQILAGPRKYPKQII